MRPLLGLGAIFFGCVFFTACGGAKAGSDDRAYSDDEAERTPAPVSGSLTEACDGVEGLTGQSVLDKLDVPSSATFRRFPPDKPYGYTDPSTATGATLRIHYAGGEVRCRPRTQTPTKQQNPSILPARVAVVVTVDFTTDDGLFDEHVTGELSSTSPDSSQILLEATIPVAALGGRYRETAETDGLGAGVDMKLSGNFTKGDRTNSEGAIDHGERFVGIFRFDR